MIKCDYCGWDMTGLAINMDNLKCCHRCLATKWDTGVLEDVLSECQDFGSNRTDSVRISGIEYTKEYED